MCKKIVLSSYYSVIGMSLKVKSHRVLDRLRNWNHPHIVCTVKGKTVDMTLMKICVVL